ncbi:Putative secreted protein [[Actinomadura] parvosata subsp. kistnae]|uniref:hypothetical protein n=1 Tax=[Actinomadura] parvosata TaxID=1955412 RepID=UPI000D2F083D|nr:Putative secreted protein [Actinomadura parvosata subsp. kistnae]
METVPARPEAGADFTLRLDLIDGSTGRPVDDLTVHHEALAHVVVTSADGRYFRHVHPLRTAPGRLEVRLRADRPGRYLAHTELEREDSGGQLLTTGFEVGGEAPAVAKTGTGDPAGVAGGAGCRACSPACPSRAGPPRSSWIPPPGYGRGSA